MVFLFPVFEREFIFSFGLFNAFLVDEEELGVKLVFSMEVMSIYKQRMVKEKHIFYLCAFYILNK